MTLCVVERRMLSDTNFYKSYFNFNFIFIVFHCMIIVY